MEIKATQRDIRQAPRKVRLVANAVKKLSLEEAIRQLAVIRRAATLPVLKTLRQAVANATHNHGLAVANLKIKELLVNDGPTLKRFRAVSRGRAHSIEKKTCHVMVILETNETTVAHPAAVTPVVQKTEKVAEAPAKPKTTPTKSKATSAKSKDVSATPKATVAKPKAAKVEKSPTKKAAK